MILFYGRIIIPFHSLSSKSKNSKMFTHSEFKLTLSFVIIGSNLIPKCLQFNLANIHFHNSLVYKTKLLEEEIRGKRTRINTLENDAKKIKEELQGKLSCLDFSYICSLFLVTNDKSVFHHDNIQKRKLKNLLEVSLKEVINDSHNPNRVIFNFSSYELSDVEKSVYARALIFQ